MTYPTDTPVVVIGAGPVGLGAAAHLAARRIAFTVLEAGAGAGAAIGEWRHVRLFSPWRYNIDAAAGRLLRAAGWDSPAPDELPTGGQLVDTYLRPLAALPELAARIRYDARVAAVTRLGYDRVRSAGRDAAPFLVRLADGEDLPARAVIDASGTWRTPNVLGGYGIAAHGEAEATAAGFIRPPLPDVLGTERSRFASRRTVVIGSGHSAATTLLDLASVKASAPDTEVVWAVRGDTAQRSYGGGDGDQLPARGALGARLRTLVDNGQVQLVTDFATQAVATASDRVVLTGRDRHGATRRLTADLVVNSTGFRPDHSISAELRLDLDPVLEAPRALAPLIDPNQHSCGTVPPHGFDQLSHPDSAYHVVGAKSYGRAPTFLLATGHEQVRSVVAALDDDWEAARSVELVLPATGVCGPVHHENVHHEDPLHEVVAAGGVRPALPLVEANLGPSSCCG